MTPSRKTAGGVPLVVLLAASAGFTALAADSSAAAEQAAFPANEDLRHVHSMADPRVSPDGQRVLVQIAETTADGGRTHLWLVDTVRNDSRQLTWSPPADKRGEFHGRWLGGGGSILFLANRAERMQLFRLPMNGGEAHAYEPTIAPSVDASAAADAIPAKKKDGARASSDPLPLEIDDFEVAPDGRAIAILARDPETAGEKRQKDALDGDVKQVIWSAQGARLIALTKGANGASDLVPDTAAWLLKISDPGHVARINELPPTIEDGCWSADGSRFFYRAQAARDAPPGYDDLFTLNMSARTTGNLTADLSGTVDGSRPIAVGSDVIQGIELGVRRSYVRIHDGKVTQLSLDGQTTQLDTDAKHTAWVWLAQSGAKPPALLFAKQLGRAPRVLSTPALLPRVWPSAIAQVVHRRNEGLNLEGLLFLPPQPVGSNVPLIVDVHGGPAGVWSDSFYNTRAKIMVLWHAATWAFLPPNPGMDSTCDSAWSISSRAYWRSNPASRSVYEFE